MDVGCNGRISDGRVFGGCTLQDALESMTSNIPASAPLPGSDKLAPYCIVADEALGGVPHEAMSKPRAIH